MWAGAPLSWFWETKGTGPPPAEREPGSSQTLPKALLEQLEMFADGGQMGLSVGAAVPSWKSVLWVSGGPLVREKDTGRFQQTGFGAAVCLRVLARKS